MAGLGGWVLDVLVLLGSLYMYKCGGGASSLGSREREGVVSTA